MTEATDLTELETGLRALRTTAPPPPADLLARVLADGLAVQETAGLTRTASPVRALALPSMVRDLGVLLGGWRVLAGFAASLALGAWIGLHPPLVFVTAAGDDGFYVVDLSAEDSFDLIEETL